MEVRLVGSNITDVKGRFKIGMRYIQCNSLTREAVGAKFVEYYFYGPPICASFDGSSI